MQTIWGKPVFDTLSELVNPRYTALVVVDMQNDFCDVRGYYAEIGKQLDDIELAVERMADLVDTARDASVLVVWIKQTLLPNAISDSPSWLRRRTRGSLPPEWTLEGSWGSDIVSPLVPHPTEPVVTKHRSSAFVGTSLDLILRSNRIQSIVIGGVVTQGCVESTARDATFFDYYVVMASDCVATTDPSLHEASMLCQSTRYDFAESSKIAVEWRSST